MTSDGSIRSALAAIVDAIRSAYGKDPQRAQDAPDGGYDPALVGYTTTTPDPRHTAPNDPRFFVLGDIMDGFHSVGSFENRNAYFGWVESQGFKLPESRENIWMPQGASPGGATAQPAVIPKELSDTAWFTSRGLDYLRGHGSSKPWFQTKT